jgi:hypothetical protein
MVQWVYSFRHLAQRQYHQFTLASPPLQSPHGGRSPEAHEIIVYADFRRLHSNDRPLFEDCRTTLLATGQIACYERAELELSLLGREASL